MKYNRKQIQASAQEILEQQVGGIRWGEILKLIHAEAPETPPNSIHGALQSLFQSGASIIKIARGTYQLEKNTPPPRPSKRKPKMKRLRQSR